MRLSKAISPILISIALTAGCATQPTSGPEPAPLPAPAPRAPTPAAPGVNLSGYPPGFRVGYADGCNSVDGTRKRDEARFKSDTDYAQGWRDGNDICKRRK
jgi:hypothetical protein